MAYSGKKYRRAAAAAEEASWYCACAIVSLILLGSLMEIYSLPSSSDQPSIKRSSGSSTPPCDEIYVVSEGETLHTISDKCGDPFIVEQNPHIQDPDDVYPGLVIKITPSSKHTYVYKYK
ncbi:hypothetical protein ACLOJK_005223 [Asimina triloba]